MRREDLEAGVVRGDEHDEHLRARGRALLLVEGDGGLVAVVPVRDQQLLVVEGADDGRVVDPPELGALDLEVGLPVGPLDRRRAVVEQEDRLELDARCAQQAKPSFLRAAVRSLVRQHGSGLVRLDLERRDQPEAPARYSIGADVVLLERPDGRRLFDEDSRRAPSLQLSCRLVLRVRQRQPHDVVGAAGAKLLPLLGRDHVVRRRDERSSGPATASS